MKSYDEMAQSVFQRRERYNTAKHKRQRIFYYAASSICVLTVVAVGVFLPLKFRDPSPFSPSNPGITSNPNSDISCSFVDSAVHSIPSSLPSENTSSSPLPESSAVDPAVSTESSTVDTLVDKTNQQGSVNKPQNEPDSSGVSSVPSVTPSRPSIRYECEFNSLKEFSSFLPKLEIEVQTPSGTVDTSIPDIITPEPNDNFWGYKNTESSLPNLPDDDIIVGAPEVSEPEADQVDRLPDAMAPAPPTEEEIWNDAQNMFDDGYYSVPYLQQGNKYLSLDRIYVEIDTIIYHYKFTSNAEDTTSSYYLNVQLYDYSIESTYKSYLKKYDYKQCTYNGITYTAFNLNNNMYDACVIWEQNGIHCRANLVGPEKYLSSIIPNLYLIQIPWSE